MEKCLYIATITYLDLQEMEARTFVLGASKKHDDAMKFLLENIQGKLKLGYRKTDFEIHTWGWTFENQYVKILADTHLLYL